jgi:predicted HicB family RNase H-like nuclease
MSIMLQEGHVKNGKHGAGGAGLVRIDSRIRQLLKVRAAQDGVSIKTAVDRAAQQYVAGSRRGEGRRGK